MVIFISYIFGFLFLLVILSVLYFSRSIFIFKTKARKFYPNLITICKNINFAKRVCGTSEISEEELEEENPPDIA